MHCLEYSFLESGRRHTVMPDNEVARALSRLCKTGVNTFPGAQPVSINRNMLASIDRSCHYITDKTDGERRLLFFTRATGQDLAVTVDRKRDQTLLSLQAPAFLYAGTILDGELVSCGGVQHFLVFDVLAFCGHRLHDLPFTERLSFFSGREDLANALATQTPRVRVKPFFRFDDFLQYFWWQHRTTYDTDGVIIMDNSQPYRAGRHWGMLKWKPQEHNTVDFRIQRGAGILTGTQKRFSLGVGAGPVKEGEIWECRRTGDLWHPVRLRKDKDTPNDVVSHDKTVENIHESLSLDELFGSQQFDLQLLEKALAVLEQHADKPHLEVEFRIGHSRPDSGFHTDLGGAALEKCLGTLRNSCMVQDHLRSLDWFAEGPSGRTRTRRIDGGAPVCIEKRTLTTVDFRTGAATIRLSVALEIPQDRIPCEGPPHVEKDVQRFRHKSWTYEAVSKKAQGRTSHTLELEASGREAPIYTLVSGLMKCRDLVRLISA